MTSRRMGEGGDVMTGCSRIASASPSPWPAWAGHQLAGSQPFAVSSLHITRWKPQQCQEYPQQQHSNYSFLNIVTFADRVHKSDRPPQFCFVLPTCDPPIIYVTNGNAKVYLPAIWDGSHILSSQMFEDLLEAAQGMGARIAELHSIRQYFWHFNFTQIQDSGQHSPFENVQVRPWAWADQSPSHRDTVCLHNDPSRQAGQRNKELFSFTAKISLLTK